MGNKESAPKTDLNDISDTSTSECQLLPDKGIPICNDRTSETSVSDKTQVERRAVDVTNICADIKQTCQSFSENQDNFNIPNSSDSLHGMYSQEIFDKLSSEGQLLCNEGILVCTDMAPERETGVNDALECDGKTMSAVLLLPSNETELKQTAMQENSDFLKFCDITQLNCSPILPSHISANLHGLACDENTLDNIPDVIVKKTLFPAALNAAVQLTAEEKDRQCEINALFVGSTLNFAEDSIIKDSSMQLPIVISTKSHFEDGLSHDGNITTKKDSDLSCDIGPHTYSVENIGAHFPDGNDCFLKTSKNSSDENNITTKKDSDLSCDIGPHTYSVENIGAHFPDGNDCFLKTSKNSSDENNITTKKDSDLSCDIGPHTYSVENIGANFPDGNHCFLKTSKDSSDENNIRTKKGSDLSGDIDPPSYLLESTGENFPAGYGCSLEIFKDSSAFDFLMKRDENASICPSQGRLSVISRFDPLVSGISSAQNDIVKSPFQPLIELENSNNEASFHYVDSTKTCQINKNVNEEEFKNALKCHEMKLEESLITFEKDKVNHINVVNHDIDCMLLQKASLTDACDIMRNSIDKGVNFVHVESVNEKFALLDSTIGRKSSIIERDQALEDLRNVEKAFSNLMLRYNNAKVALEQMKENELSLKQEVEQCMKESCEEQEKYNALHVHADEQLNIVNEELIKFQKDHESEKAALTAMLRKSELRVRSLTTTLNQIVNDNHELLRMCEEFGYKKTM